ncbi:MAG TPA: MipA/OmpV family protein [Steroidobacteraceae bacterium]|nr:MipA/OmpV family protein [Steroidobacteraceae bacterium]
MSHRFPKRARRWFILGCAFICAVAQAEEKPLWEAGLGVGGLSFPDYRGSDESQAYPIPVPYFVYRGRFLKADKEGVRGQLFDREYAELSVSVNATIPVNSDNNNARRGMPDLKPTIELGPSLDLHVWKSADASARLDVVMPVRAPITVERSPQSIGWIFSPRLNLDVDNVAGFSGWTFGVGIGPIFADRKYHDYFYSVDPQYATATRPLYRASGGYSGSQFLSSISKRFDRFWVGAYVRVDVLNGATFDDSPLVRSHHYIAGGFGFARMIGHSQRTVQSDDD